MLHLFAMSFEWAILVVLPIYLASHTTVEDKVVLSHLIDEFLEADLADLDQMLYHRRAFVFCLVAGFLFNRHTGIGDLSLCTLVSQIDIGHCIGGLLLAETIRSLDRAALGFEEWSVAPIILQV